MKEFYVYASSSATTKHPENKCGDFTLSLPHSIDLNDGEWKVGLCDFTYVGDKKTLVPDIFLCTDIIELNYDSTTSLPILRFLERETSPGQQTFANIYYCTVKPKQLETIRLYLNSTEKVIPSVEDTAVFCTLHFKQNG